MKKKLLVLVVTGILIAMFIEFYKYNSSSNTNELFIRQLEEKSYFQNLTPTETRVLKDIFNQKGWDGIFYDKRRLVNADAEALAEGGVGEFIKRVEPFLSVQGVKLPEISDVYSEESYVVRVGNAPYKIWDRSEIQNNWGLASARGFAIIDKLLKEAGSQEQLYAINGGNDLFGFFLTPELYQIISAHPNASLNDGPYKLTEESPWFGQPHK